MKALNTYNAGAYRRDDREDQMLSTQEYVTTRGLWRNLDTSADAYLAKKMKEEALKIQKENQNKGPQGPVMS